MPTSTVEDYLKQIFVEEQRRPGELVSTGRIASALDLAPGTVTAMVKVLAERDLVSYAPYAGVRLTGEGRRLAARVLRRHRLVELFLVEVMGIDWSEVHQDAERLEHAVSDRLIDRMDEMLDYPAVDPHGDPIPTVDGSLVSEPLSSLLRCPVGDLVRIARIGDQTREFLRLVESRGLKPGREVVVVGRDEAADTVEVRVAEGSPVSLGHRAASKILVSRVASGVWPQASKS